MGGPLGAILGALLGATIAAWATDASITTKATITGAVIGGIIGLALGGPLGAAIGAAIGAGIGLAAAWIWEHAEEIGEEFKKIGTMIGEWFSLGLVNTAFEWLNNLKNEFSRFIKDPLGWAGGNTPSPGGRGGGPPPIPTTFNIHDRSRQGRNHNYGLLWVTRPSMVLVLQARPQQPAANADQDTNWRA